ncbi:MAG: hypothetical protein EOO22_01320 [Comamonadaceae bacterium]|nr:MAG: hypothetical protein EOO22_01320 [Comamonadaceae bacterium]
MTLLNYWITPKKAIVAVDTQAMILEAPDSLRDLSKMLYLPHANVILAGRGSVDMLYLAYIRLLQIGTHFDMIRDLLDAHLTTFAKDAKMQMERHGTALPAMRQELLLVGYSDSSSSMQVRLFTIDLEGAVTSDDRRHDARPSIAHPVQGQWLKNPNSIGAMHRLACEQVVWADTDGSGASFGGRLLYAELTKDSLNMGSVGELRQAP